MAFSLRGIITPLGILKVAHVALGTVCFGEMFGYTMKMETEAVAVGTYHLVGAAFYSLFTIFACLVGSLSILISFIHEETAEKVKESTFEIVYHTLAFFLYFPISTMLFSQVIFYLSMDLHNLQEETKRQVSATFFLAIFVFMNSLAYFGNALIAILKFLLPNPSPVSTGMFSSLQTIVSTEPVSLHAPPNALAESKEKR